MEQFFSQYADEALENLSLQIVRQPDTNKRSEETALLVEFWKREEPALTSCKAETSHQAA